MTLKQVKKAYNKYKSCDPYPDIAPALLNKWDIQNYIHKTGMIFPFHEDDLKGITYDVRLRGTCLYWQEEKGETTEHSLIVDDKLEGGSKTIELLPNSITFVTLEPYFQIPEYIALRYNFKINQVYKGLLLGTGPIVDPGFHGYLSIPIHNLTKNRYTIKVDEPLISIEFTKINPYKDGIYSKKLPQDYKKTKDFPLTERKVRDYVTEALKFVPDETLPKIESNNKGICNSVPSLENAVTTAIQRSVEAVKEHTNSMETKVKERMDGVENRAHKDYISSLIAIIVTVVLAFAATIVGFWAQTGWLDDNIEKYEQRLTDEQNKNGERILNLEKELEITNRIIFCQRELVFEKNQSPTNKERISLLETELEALFEQLEDIQK